MRQDKELIFRLRKEGKSYREIEKETGVSRATLCTWFKNSPWSRNITSEYQKKNVGASRERMQRMNMVRRLKLQYQYALVEREAEKEYKIFRADPLFWAGLMIYAGEGDKISRGLVRISSGEFYVHRVFILFLHKYLGIKTTSIRFCLLLYPEQEELICKEKWRVELAVEPLIFHKTQIIKGKISSKRLQYGVGMSIISSTSLKKRLLRWLLLAENENFENAGMVQG